MVPQGPPTGQQVRLAVVIPVYNERQNVPLVFEKVQTALNGIAHEVVFVDDDSPDGTAEAVRDLAHTNASVRLIRRIGRRGLASATIEGMLATTAPFIAVIDADLQHDETLLPEMLRLIEEKDLELVIGSRNVEGGSMGNLARERIALSNVGRRLATMVTGHNLRDPMSGFFMLRSTFLNEVVHRASGVGFKILLDLVASATRPVRFMEIGYQFRPRQHGVSKLDVSVGLEYLYLIADKRLGHVIPVRFTLFVIAGLAGLGLYLAVLGSLYLTGLYSFQTSLLTATVVAMTVNFVLNNRTTFRERRLRGWNWLRGLVIFYAACGAGAYMNLQVAEGLLAARMPWFVAGAAGMIMIAVWNYGVTAVFAWRIHRR